jgi:hypothetical protein
VTTRYNIPEDCHLPGDNMFLRNDVTYLQVHQALQPRKPTSTTTVINIIRQSQNHNSVNQRINFHPEWATITALMIYAESTSETSVNFYQTIRHNNSEDSHLRTAHNNPEDSHPRTLRRENFKSNLEFRFSTLSMTCGWAHFTEMFPGSIYRSSYLCWSSFITHNNF